MAPAMVGDDAFVGMQAPGVSCGTRYVPALTLATMQEQADALPAVTAGYAYRNMDEGAVKVNVQLAKAGQPKQINR